jgi:flavin-dependent dehydrogenase
VLDNLLVQAACEAGAELREAFTVDEILIEDGVVTGIRRPRQGRRPGHGARVSSSAPDGKHSLVAKTVCAESYHEVPQLQTGYYAY